MSHRYKRDIRSMNVINNEPLKMIRWQSSLNNRQRTPNKIHCDLHPQIWKYNRERIAS